MHRYRIRLDTMSNIQRFVAAAQKIEHQVVLKDEDGNCVSAKSILGAIYTMEWARIYCYCDKEIYEAIEEWICE